MHPAPSALPRMTTNDLRAYSADLRRKIAEGLDTSGAYAERVSTIDGILRDRAAANVASFVNGFGR